MKRKFLAVAMAFALTAGMLSGCSSSTGSAPENKETQTSAAAATEAAKTDETKAEETFLPRPLQAGIFMLWAEMRRPPDCPVLTPIKCI